MNTFKYNYKGCSGRSGCGCGSCRTRSTIQPNSIYTHIPTEVQGEPGPEGPQGPQGDTYIPEETNNVFTI